MNRCPQLGSEQGALSGRKWVNNAGIADSTATDELDLALWHEVIGTNSPPHPCARCNPHHQARGARPHHQCGSISVRVPRASSPAYTASKWGLDGLTRALVIGGRDHNIVVSIMDPGIVATELAPDLAALPDDFAASPQDIADVIINMANIPDHLNY